MESNVINTRKNGQRVSSTYAEIYFADDHCDYRKPSTSTEVKETTSPKPIHDDETEGVWVSPSDLLVGIIELKPPFTSKITRGITHEGILGIGDEILMKERATFVKLLTTLIHENDAAWKHILQHEIATVNKKVQKVYEKIFKEKTQIMNEEISIYYEKSLQELENHVRSQVKKVLNSTHGSIVCKLNTEIKNRLKKEKNILENVLQKRYESEIIKIKKYYKLLLSNELARNSSWINRAITQRNDALKAFYRQIEAENITSTMYILCTERKRCKIKQFIMKNYQNLELKEKYQKIKERQDVINIFKDREIHISQINREWEEKIKKILQLFLKFISFSLKLLPEQSTFLLDFEKIVVLQLNEIQKRPQDAKSILIDEEKIMNMFQFPSSSEEHVECTKEPFVLIGDLSIPEPPRYGSRETIPSDVDLPTVRLQRQFVYAKCHKYEDIKALLEAERCKCVPDWRKQPSVSLQSEESVKQPSVFSIKSESSYEPLPLDDIQRLDDCPVRNCKDWIKQSTFPHLESYLDYDDEKFETVKAILGKPSKKRASPVFVDPKDIAYKELPFTATKEPYHTIGTQYSSQEDLSVPQIECTCIDNTPLKSKETPRIENSPSKNIVETLAKRKASIRRLLQQNPNLLEMFTDESFDFQY